MIFKPMLATEANLDILRFPCYVSAKLDGVRCCLINGKALTRNLKPIPNHYIRGLLEAHADILEGFDGELIVGPPTTPFNETSSAVMSRDGEPDFTFWVFDRVAGGSYEDRWPIGYLTELEDTLPAFARVLFQHFCPDISALNDYEEHYVNRKFEGIMTRDPEGLYKFGRATARSQELLKIKRFADDEATIIGFKERLHNANEATTNALGRTERSSHKANMVPMGTLGALICKSEKFTDTFDIGTGFNDAQRREIWDNRQSYLGKLAKYKFQECGTLDRPRFPVYLGIRDERDL